MPEYKATVPMAEGETADQLRYKYNIAGLGKSRNNFIGMQEYEGPTVRDVKSVLFEKSPEQKTIETLNREPVKIERPIEGESVAFDNKDNSLMTKAADEKQTEKMIEALQPKQEEYRKKTLDELGQEKINNLVLRPEEPKQTNYVSSFLKGFANAPLNMAFDIYSGLDALGVDLGNKIAEWKTGEKIDIEQEKIQRIVNLRNSQSAVVSALGLDLKKNDSELFFDGGSALSSLFLSMGVAGVSKSVNAMAALIGTSAGGRNYAVLREKGVAPLESFAVAVETGLAEGFLEKSGVHNLIELYTVKLGKGTALRQLGKAFAVEGTQEASQSLAGNFLMAPYEKGYQGKDWIKQAAYEGMLGGLAGIAGGGVALSVTQKTRAKYASIFEKEMNMTPETARALAEQVVLEPEQAQKVIEEIVDNETLSNLENKNLVDDALKNKAEAEDLLSEILEQKALGLSDEVEAKSDEFAESIKQQAIKAGDSEENAEAAAVLTKNLVRNIAQTRIEQGVDANTAISDLIDDVQSAVSAVEDLDPNIAGGGKKFVEVEEERPELTEEQRRRELQEERIDIMAGEGMNEDEARFRVMTGKEPDELDRKLGFDFIPYQLGEALTERENGYKIADDNETVEAVTIPDDAVPEFKTRSDLRNWLIGKFNEIGNVTINSTGANIEFNNTAAKRVVKNSRNRINNIAYPEIEKVVSGAKYSGFRRTDERHQNVRGQDVYHSGVVYKGVPYSVEFYVDVPLHGNTGDNFAGNKVSKIRIEPQRYGFESVAKGDESPKDSIHNISLEVLRGKVKPARYDASTSTYYQVAEENARLDAENPIYNGETININGQEKTVYNSNGDRIAQSAEALRNFYKWFGDSKVVDEQGRPLVVYHGTNAEFSVFDKSKQKDSSYYGKGFYFTNWSDVSTYGKIKMPLHLNIKNPLIIKEGDVSSLKAVEDVIGVHPDMPDEQKEWDFEGWAKYTLGYRSDIEGNIESVLSSKGYDGVVILDTENDGQRNKYIAFNPNQIKSVENRGSFSPESDNIYYQLGEKITPELQNLKDFTVKQETAHHYELDMGGKSYWLKKSKVDEDGNFLLPQKSAAAGANADVTKGILNYPKSAENGIEIAVSKNIKQDIDQLAEMSNSGLGKNLQDEGIDKFAEEWVRNRRRNEVENMSLTELSYYEISSLEEANEMIEDDPEDNSFDRSEPFKDEQELREFLYNRQLEDIENMDVNLKALREDDWDKIREDYEDTLARKNFFDEYEYVIEKLLEENGFYVIDDKSRISDSRYVDVYKNKEDSIEGEPFAKIRISDHDTHKFYGHHINLYTTENVYKEINKLLRSFAGGEFGVEDTVYYQGQIADNAGAVELTINTAEETAGVSEDEFKQKMLDTLKSFKGNKIFNQSLGGEIEIRTSSIKKYKSFFADKNKRLIVPYIPELLAKARFTKEASYTKATEPNIKAYYKSDLPINIDNDLYNVHLTVREDQNGNFFWDAQIKESPQHAAPATNPGDTGAKAEQSAFEDSISLEKKEVNKSYYQSAFAGSRVDYDRPSLEAIGSGEGNQAHGWGLYYALNRDVAEKYKYAFTVGFQSTEDYVNKRKEYYTRIRKFAQEQVKFLQENKKPDEIYFGDETVAQAIKRLTEAQKLHTKRLQELSAIDVNKPLGQVHEVDIPENPYLLDEQKPFSEQSDIVKKGIIDTLNSMNLSDKQKAMFKDNIENRRDTGKEIYEELTIAMAKSRGAGLQYSSKENMPFVSKALSENGVKGITYYGREDGRCFVIFNPKDVKVIQKFYQTGELGLEGGREKAPFGAQAQSQKEKVIYQVFGQYEPAKKLITLFQGKNSTTLVHELLHHYLPIYLTELEKAGKFEQLKGLYEALGVQSYSDIARQRAKMEQLIDLGTSYIYYNESPNEASRSLFERAKQWMLDAYDIVKKFVKPSKEVDAFFNELFAREEENLPDIRDLKGKSAELAKILKGAASGQELTVNGLSLRDIANLRKTLYARIPRAGESLADAIRQAGGIDTESALAKALGYDSRKGSDMGFWNYKGAINDESSLIDFLTANGYLNQTESQSYDDTSAIWDKVEKLINDRNSVYNEKNQRQQEYRENALSAQKLVSEILTEHYIGDVKKLEEDLRGATKLLADKGGVAVDKLTLEYLARSVEQMDKKYRKLLYQKKEKGYNYRNQLNAYIEEMPLDFKHKSWLKALIKNVSDENSFNRELAKIKERGEKYIDQEAKTLYDNVIQDEVKSSRPKKVMQQKYDYENNKLFKDLREWNKMTQEQAAAALVQFGEPENRIDLLRRMFLEYKANGKSSSVELMKQLSEMIKEAKQSGIEAKNESDFMKSFNREQAREEILKKLDASEADKNKLTTKIANAYRKLGTNLYSMLNSIAGKDVAEKYEMETVFDRKEQKEHNHIKKINQKAMEIYKVKSYGDFLNLVVDKGVKIDKLFRRAIDENMAPEQMDVENYDANMGYDVSILDIIDIYNAIKNKKTAEDYYKSYGAEQINRLLNLLSEEDKAFGDLMMADVNSRFKALNEVYVRLYGMDLKKVEDYWMGSAEHNKPVDIYNDFQMQGTTPGFFKERVSGAVVPVAKNAWLKYQKHISQSYYMTEIAEKYKELADIFNSNRIETRINNHFGEDVYHALRQQISALGLNAQSSELDDVSGAFQKMLNGWVGAKISVNPIVFVGQLTSFTNYAEGVNTSDFIKNIGYALLHPKQAFDFMIKYNGDFIKHRYEAGYNEAMTSFIAQAQTASKSKYGVSAKTRFNYTNALSSFVRTGDIGAIIFGGYGQFKTMLDSGMSLEEAQKAFEFSTLRSQQSGNAASLSKFQQSKGFSRLFLSFKNTSQQYMRKIADTVIMLQNGDISKAEGAKILTNYLLIQPALWVFAKNVAKALLGLDDDDDKLTDGILEQILVNPIDAVPLLNDIIKATYKKASGEKVHQVFSTPLFDDLEKSWRKAWKEDKTMFDYADVIAPFIEMATSAPVGTAKRYVKALSDKWGE